MVLNICRKMAKDEEFLITVNDEVKLLNRETWKVSFELNEKRTYIIDIQQKESKNDIRPSNIILFLITSIIQGIFNTIFMKPDSDWYNEINPYCVKAKLLIDLQKDTDIHLEYVKFKYDTKNSKWLLPIFKVEPNILTNINFTINSSDFF